MLVLVDQQGAHAFDQVAVLEPLAVQVQLHRKASFQAQLATAAEHVQGHGHGQGRAASQQFGGFKRPFVAVGNGHLLQLLNHARQIGQGKEVVDGRSQHGQGRVGQVLHAELGQQALHVLERVPGPGQGVEAFQQPGQLRAVQVPVGQPAIQGICSLDLHTADAQVDAQLAGNARQEIAAAHVREIADAGFRHGQAAAFGDHAQVGTLDQAHAAAEGKAIHQGQDRLAVTVDTQVQGIFFDEEVLVNRVATLEAFVQRADIAAGAKALFPVAAQDHGVDLRVDGPGIELGLQAAHHVQGQGIEAAGAIEGQVTDVVADFALDVGIQRTGSRLGRRSGLGCHRYLPALLLIFQKNWSGYRVNVRDP
ncbi:hypothetical protein D3C85_1057360 [compost metagenome]